MASEIIREFLRIDEAGDVDLLDAARSVVTRVSPGDRAGLVYDAVCVLPASLLATFIEGALTAGDLPGLDQALLTALPSAREVSTGAVIFRLLRDDCQIPQSELALRLQQALDHATSATGRSAVEYAISCFRTSRRKNA